MTDQPDQPHQPEDLRGALQSELSAHGWNGEVTALRWLTGGTRRETWAFEVDGRRYVLRRDPPHMPDPVTMQREGAALAAAASVGVAVPAVHVAGDGVSGVGTPFLVMDWLDGETIPRRLLRDERFAAVRPRLAAELGGILARIHSVPAGAVPVIEQDDRLTRLRRWHDEFNEPRPAMELAFRWLEEHQPAPVEPTLVHGDFRNGNLLIDETGVRAVLDWELVHAGDPAEDLGWLCSRAWRFGSPLPVGGFGTREQLLEGYRAVTGSVPDPERLHWWEVYASVHWGVICRMQAERYLSGAERSVEMAVLGRRIAECEYDALVTAGLLDPAARPAPIPPPDAPPPTTDVDGLYDPPSIDGLLDAVQGVLHDQLDTQHFDDTTARRFAFRVAENAVTIARRQLAARDGHAAQHRARLGEIGVDSDRVLADRIRDGSLDHRHDEVVATAAALVLAKLAVVNPGYLTAP